MKVYDKNTFKSSLISIKKIYCSNELQYGLRLLPTKIALDHKYIQVNNDKAIMFLVIDLDHNNPLIFENVGLPAPNFIVIDKEKSTSHYYYAINKPIYKDYIDNQKALLFFSKIQQAYTKALQGDPLYAGMIAKNPLHHYWKTWNNNHFYAYDLYELAEYVELPKQLTKREAIGEGRNCWLFDAVRKFAYKEVLFYKANEANEKDFYNVILNRLEKLNTFALPLDFNELKAIAKSISKWTWAHFSVERFSEIQSARGKIGGKIGGKISGAKKQEKKRNNLEILKHELS
ncbi:replication initiation protein [Glaesserella parasuis]|nr:replication initiation protein [Glaesserella parasuis]